MAGYTLPFATDLKICQVLTGWDSLERKMGKAPVIDFNLPDFNDQLANDRYSCRAQVLADLVDLQKEPAVIANARVAQKLAAQEAYLRNLMGEQWEFSRYVQATMGFKPAYFTETEIGRQRRNLEARLAPFRIEFNADLKKRIDEADRIIPAAQIADFYAGIRARNTPRLRAMVGDIPDFTFRTETASVDEYWSNWVSGSGTNYKLRLNTLNVPDFYEGDTIRLGLHEILAHLCQAAIIVRQIENEETPRCMGLTTVHGPEQFQSEGLAQTIYYFLDTPDAKHPLANARNEMSDYSGMVVSNLHMMINSGKSIEECVDYGAPLIPYRTRDEIAESLGSKVNNPQYRCYEYVYGPSAAFFRNFSGQASPGQKQAFLAAVYRDWLPAHELAALTKGLLHGPSAPNPPLP